MLNTIKTERLLLRKFETSDALALSIFYADPETMHFMGGVRSLGQTQEKVKENAAYFDRDGYGYMAVTLKETQELIGCAGFLHQLVDGKEEIEIGYLLGRKFWGCGYAVEATKALVEYGFRSLHIPRLISIIHPDNYSSIKVAEKMNMSYEKESVYKGQKVKIYAIKNPTETHKRSL